MVKLGPNKAVAQERVALERVEEVLGNNAPHLRSFVDLGSRAGLKYSYASMGQGTVASLQAMFARKVPTERLISTIRETFEEVLGSLYAAARYERLALFDHYQFSAAWAPRVRASVAAITPHADSEFLAFPGGVTLPNVRGFYEHLLSRSSPRLISRLWLPDWG